MSYFFVAFSEFQRLVFGVPKVGEKFQRLVEDTHDFFHRTMINKISTTARVSGWVRDRNDR